MKALSKKSIAKYLYIKQSLLSGLDYEKIRISYTRELKKIKTIKEKEITAELKSLYKIYYFYFRDCNSKDGLKNLIEQFEQEEKLF